MSPYTTACYLRGLYPLIYLSYHIKDRCFLIAYLFIKNAALFKSNLVSGAFLITDLSDTAKHIRSAYDI